MEMTIMPEVGLDPETVKRIVFGVGGAICALGCAVSFKGFVRETNHLKWLGTLDTLQWDQVPESITETIGFRRIFVASFLANAIVVGIVGYMVWR